MTGPGVSSISGIYGGGGSIGRSYRSGSSALAGQGSSNVIVNIYDGTGQKISEYDSALRIEVKERAARNNEFSALA